MNKKAVTLTYFELGQVMGLIYGNIERLRPELRIKLRLAMAQAYINHPQLKDEARKDIRDYKAELAKLKYEK